MEMNASKNIQSYINFLPQDKIDYLSNLPEVIAAKKAIDKRNEGAVYFNIKLTPDIQEIIKNLGLDLSNKDTLPMRWIKGDTQPHIDNCSQKFNNTYLVYLTNSLGNLVIDNDSYPITQGSAYVFNEGLKHHTLNTGLEPRLMIGPMSEEGLKVGSGLSAPGGTFIYFRQTGPLIEYSFDSSTWMDMSGIWPCQISNTSPADGFLTLVFTTDLALLDSTNYFICYSEKIQFGSRTLNPDGTRPKIIIEDIANWPGFIQNGSEFINGYNYINVFNLEVRSGFQSSLLMDESGTAGWLCAYWFGKESNNNFIINCSASDDGTTVISSYGGGIVGSSAGSGSTGVLKLIGCSSSSQIFNDAGGIVGAFAGRNIGNVTCEYCWSTGQIYIGAGGIFGSYAGSNGSIIAKSCYSTGFMQLAAGGICGAVPGDGNGYAVIMNCYSTGQISYQGGGIVGAYPSGNITISNCYTTGRIDDSQGKAGGITGELQPPTPITITNCYTSGPMNSSSGYIIGGSSVVPATCYSEQANGSSGWSSINANTVLTGLPNPVVGTTWVASIPGDKNPYELFQMGYSPYAILNINDNPTFDLNRLFALKIVAGSSTLPAVISGLSYSKLQIDYGDPDSYSTITVNSTTGVISTTNATVPGIYNIYIRNNGSYNISIYGLEVMSGVPCLTEDTMVLTPDGYKNITKLKKGDIVKTSDDRDVEITLVLRTNVVGNHKTYPCRILKNSIGPNYPEEDLLISRDHLIKYKNYWIYPMKYFPLEKNQDIIKYYHIMLPDYSTDNLVINNGVVVESLNIHDSPATKERYIAEYKRRKDSIKEFPEEEQILKNIMNFPEKKSKMKS